MKEINGFLSKDEIIDAANNIGDVKTPEGKARMVEFLAKSVHALESTDEINGVIVDAFFINFLTKSTVKDKGYYFENGKLKPGFDIGDSIIGNAIGNLSGALGYGDRIIMDYYTSTTGNTFRPYTDEELSSLKESCIGNIETDKGMGNR